jgi:hypothetical protein
MASSEDGLRDTLERTSWKSLLELLITLSRRIQSWFLNFHLRMLLIDGSNYANMRSSTGTIILFLVSVRSSLNLDEFCEPGTKIAEMKIELFALQNLIDV